MAPCFVPPAPLPLRRSAANRRPRRREAPSAFFNERPRTAENEQPARLPVDDATSRAPDPSFPWHDILILKIFDLGATERADTEIKLVEDAGVQSKQAPWIAAWYSFQKYYSADLNEESRPVDPSPGLVLSDADAPPLPTTTAPSPWLQAALLTLFEPVPEKVEPEPEPTPPETPRWLMVWHSLQALYSMRLRLRPRPIVPPPKIVEKTPETPARFDKARAVSRVVVFVSDMLADAVVLEMFAKIHHPTDLFDIGLGVLAAYGGADLVSALYNWLRLNFSANTAVFGPGKADEAVHRSFSRTVAPHCAAVAPCLALLLAGPPSRLCEAAFAVYFLTFVTLLPAFHAWSADDRRVPRVIVALQRAGVIVRRSSEASLHRLEYGLVCGVWDSFLKRLRIFSALERWIYIHSGGRVRPKVWDIVPEARVRACGPNDELVRAAVRRK